MKTKEDLLEILSKLNACSGAVSFVRVCIETAKRWTHGNATMDELRVARRNAAYAAYAAYTADADAARFKTLAQCADIVRKHYPAIPTP